VPYALIFIVIVNVDVTVAESTRLAQVEDHVESINTEDSAVQTSASGPSVVEFVAAPVAVEATTIIVLEVLTMTSASKKPVVGFIPVQIELALVFEDTTRTIMERGSESASAGLSPAMDIMEELAHQMVQKFFTSMKSCIELVLSGGSSFEFARMLFENQIENICHTGSSEQARAYLTLVE